MMPPRTRLVIAACLAAAAAAASLQLVAQSPAPSEQRESRGPSVEISFAPAARSQPVTGMVYLAISKDNKTTPIQQTDPEGVPLFRSTSISCSPAQR